METGEFYLKFNYEFWGLCLQKATETAWSIFGFVWIEVKLGSNYVMILRQIKYTRFSSV